GWAKPVQVNPYNFRDPARGMMISTACGPLANFTQALVVGLVLRVILSLPDPLFAGHMLLGFLGMLVMINLVLGLFNLIPLGPLDGHHIMEYFLPYPAKENYTRFNRQYGAFILFGLILLPFVLNVSILAYVIFLPAQVLGTHIVGENPWALAHEFLLR
ncbi:MAG: site-2 protease family protein, partial [Candidatus Brocadiaceae bacterium]